MAKAYHIYNTHIPLDVWEKIVKELKKEPHLGDRRNSHNRIINKALTKYFKR